MDNGNMPDDWKPAPLPPIGCLQWKRDIVERSVKIGAHQDNASYDVEEVGTFVIQRTPGGWNYFWVDVDKVRKIPPLDWAQIERDHIAGK